MRPARVLVLLATVAATALPAASAVADDPGGAAGGSVAPVGPVAPVAPVASVGDKAARTGPTGSGATAARQALQRVEDISEGRTRGDLTIALRDLNIRRAALSGREEAQAAAYFSRPVASETRCTTTFCLHWQPAQVAPGYIDQVAEAVASVQQRYLAAGYRAVKSDGDRGGNALPDIYVDDIGAEGIYGYCSTDQEFDQTTQSYDSWAYCVLDNDYSTTEFPTNTPLENLQVTAAHEYFHAVQFAYDYFEDRWLMESTATWAEDELYDDVDDNIGYLGRSPLSDPAWSLDRFGDGHQYGTWIFFRYLTERFTAEEGGMPTLVRDVWRRADGSLGGPDAYSLQAVAAELAARGTTLRRQFTAFSVANRRPARAYEEASANGYPAAPLGSFTLRRGWYQTKLDHLTSATGRFVPRRGTKKLVVSVDMAPTAHGSTAAVTVLSRSGAVRTYPVSLNRSGNGSRTVPFKKSAVAAVEITLVNASERFHCWTPGGTAYSCSGTPRDENVVAKVKGVARY